MGFLVGFIVMQMLDVAQKAKAAVGWHASNNMRRVHGCAVRVKLSHRPVGCCILQAAAGICGMQHAQATGSAPSSTTALQAAETIHSMSSRLGAWPVPTLLVLLAICRVCHMLHMSPGMVSAKDQLH